MNQAMPPAVPAVPPEVYAFAEEQGVSAYLPAILEMTRAVFPKAPLNVCVRDDPELADNRSIAFDVDVPPDLAQARKDHRRWNDGLFECCPAPLVCTFVLSMNLVEE
jgi:hypothetical protein